MLVAYYLFFKDTEKSYLYHSNLNIPKRLRDKKYLYVQEVNL